MLTIILVLILSPNVALCKMVVTPDLLVPVKQLNEACGYDACPIPLSENGINVHIVPHTHYELAFQRTFHEHYVGKDNITEFYRSDVNMKRTLDGVITELWEHEHRRFTLSDMPYFFHWWSQRDENVRQMVFTLIRQGRLSFVGGGWSMNDEATTNYHAIIDSFTYSLRKLNATFWECGRPQVAWQADVFGHSREFASLAAQMGYDALFVNPISFDDELARMRRWGLEMLWRGSDDLGSDSDIFTHKLFDGYWAPPGFCFSTLCTDPLIVTSNAVFRNVEERAKAFMDSMYHRQAPNYNSSHVMVIMGMMLGYHDSPYWFSNIDALINAVNGMAKSNGIQKMYLMYSTPACYAKAVRDSGMPLETKQDDFLPLAYDKFSYLTGLYTSFPSIKLMAREILVYLQMCKQLRVFAEIGPHQNTLFEELNWVMGAFQDHSIITGYLKHDVKSYYMEKMYSAIQRSTLLLKEAWNKLRKCPEATDYYRCSLNVSRCHHIIGDTYFVQIQNVLAWPVTKPVRMPIQYFGEEFRVYDPKGNIVNSAVIKIPESVLKIHSRVNVSNYEVVFIAKDLPPLGFRSYFIERVTARFRRKRDNTENNREDTENEREDTENIREYLQVSNEKNNSQDIDDRYDARQRRPLIKNINRKSNKKYLIRQTNPTIDDDSLLYDLDEEYDDTPANNTKTGKENVTMLLESDMDEIHMQKIPDNDLDRFGGTVETVLDPTELQEQHPMYDRQTTTKKEQQTTNEEQQSTKTEQTTTSTMSPKQEQTTVNTLGHYETVSNDMINTQRWDEEALGENNIVTHFNETNVTSTTIKPQDWDEVTLKEINVTNNTIKSQHWNEVALKEINKQKHFSEISVPSATLKAQDWNEVAFRETAETKDTVKSQHWNKLLMKDLNAHRPVNNIFDFLPNKAPNRTPMPKLFVTQTQNYYFEFNGSPTHKMLQKDIFTTDDKNKAYTEAYEDIKNNKVKGERTTANKDIMKEKGERTAINKEKTKTEANKNTKKVQAEKIAVNNEKAKTEANEDIKKVEEGTTVINKEITKTEANKDIKKVEEERISVNNEKAKTEANEDIKKVEVERIAVNNERAKTEADKDIKKVEKEKTAINKEKSKTEGDKDIKKVEEEKTAINKEKIKTEASKDIKKVEEQSTAINKEKTKTEARKDVKKVEAERITVNNEKTKTEADKDIKKVEVERIAVNNEKAKTVANKDIKTVEAERIAVNNEKAKTEANENINKIEEQRTIAAKGEPPNEIVMRLGPTESKVIGDTMLQEEFETKSSVKDATKVKLPSLEVAPASENEIPSNYEIPRNYEIDRRNFEKPSELNETMQEPQHARNDDDSVTHADVVEDLEIVPVNKTYIENRYIRIIIDQATSKITSVTLSNGLHIALDIQFYYYVSDDPDALGKIETKRPGAVLFRAMENTPIPILDFIDVEVFKNDVVEEAHIIYSTWASFVIRLYDESPVIEVEWLIGPIPVDDKLGKEVFVRYFTNLLHDGVFYTDSNGRQTIKRIRHMRPMFESLNLDNVAGNYYPVTSKISIEDLNANLRFSVFVDRAQGGTSLADGEVDLMLNRRILTADSSSETFANDTEYGKGAVVRGKHYLYISKADHKPYRIFEKKFTRELELTPQILVSRPDPYLNYSKQIWLNSVNEVSFLKKKLPIGVHLLSLEEWNGDTILLRLENYLEKNDTLRGWTRTVYIQEMFTNIYVTNVKETTLGANMWKEDRERDKFSWPRKENFVRSFNDFYGVNREVEFLTNEEQPQWKPVNLKQGIKLAPQQIRTFVCNFDYVEL